MTDVRKGRFTEPLKVVSNCRVRNVRIPLVCGSVLDGYLSEVAPQVARFVELSLAQESEHAKRLGTSSGLLGGQ